MIFKALNKVRPMCGLHCPLNSVFNKRTHNTSSNSEQKKRIQSTVYYLSSLGVLTVGLSYAAVPLYKMFCQVRIFIIF
jgi:cytochrome c oxidase assembly protein subunit 11